MSGFWSGRPVFVTGATGFVGGWLVRSLVAQGAEVICLARDWVPSCDLLRTELERQVVLVRGDVVDQELLERALGEYEIDTVFHLAAQTIVSIASRNPISTFDTNIRGTWALLEACRRSPQVKQIVVASSDKAYGDAVELPYSEQTALRGRFPYDVSKSCADLISASYAYSYGSPVVITRCGNFYGGGDLNFNRVVPGTIRSVLRGERPVIRSDGTYIRDYFYVEDGVSAYIQLAERLAAEPELKGEAFNFSDELQMNAYDLVRRITARMGSDLVPDVRNEATNEIQHQYLSAEYARRRLGWKPLFTLDEGLDRSIAWYTDFLRSKRTL